MNWTKILHVQIQLFTIPFQLSCFGVQSCVTCVTASRVLMDRSNFRGNLRPQSTQGCKPRELPRSQAPHFFHLFHCLSLTYLAARCFGFNTTELLHKLFLGPSFYMSSHFISCGICLLSIIYLFCPDGIIERLGLGGTLKITLFQPGCHGLGTLH